MNDKKGISGIIATVLLIILTVGAASILFVFIIPWINAMLDNAKVCNDLQDSITLVEGKYTCYNSANPVNTSVMIKINAGKDIEVAGFAVSLTSSGSAKRYDVKNGTSANVRMYNGSATLTVPEVGGAETYIFPVKAESVDVSPLTSSGKTCNPVTQKLIDCSLA